MEKMIIDEHDVEIGRYILAILRSRPDIVCSWGLDPKTLRPVKYGIQFHVQGFKHTGLVRVTLNEGEDLFEVSLISENDQIVKTTEHIFLGDLISVIDENIEKCENYENRICQEYGIVTG